jgi:hypothetical protein
VYICVCEEYRFCPFLRFFPLCYLEKEFQDTKGVIGIRKSKKNRQHKRTKEKKKKEFFLKDNKRSTTHTYKTTDRVTRTPLTVLTVWYFFFALFYNLFISARLYGQK